MHRSWTVCQHPRQLSDWAIAGAPTWWQKVLERCAMSGARLGVVAGALVLLCLRIFQHAVTAGCYAQQPSHPQRMSACGPVHCVRVAYGHTNILPCRMVTPCVAYPCHVVIQPVSGPFCTPGLALRRTRFTFPASYNPEIFTAVLCMCSLTCRMCVACFRCAW